MKTFIPGVIINRLERKKSLSYVKSTIFKSISIIFNSLKKKKIRVVKDPDEREEILSYVKSTIFKSISIIFNSLKKNEKRH